MPISSGAHGWSLEYRNKPPRVNQRRVRDQDVNPPERNYRQRRKREEPDTNPSPKKRRRLPYPAKHQSVHPYRRQEQKSWSHSDNQKPDNGYNPNTKSDDNPSFGSDHEELYKAKEREPSYPVIKTNNVENKDTIILSSTDENESVEEEDNDPIEDKNHLLVEDTDKNEHMLSPVPEVSESSSQKDDRVEDNEGCSKNQKHVDSSREQPNIVPVIIPKHPPGDYESSRTPSPASSHYDTRRFETSDFESSSESVKNIKAVRESTEVKSVTKQESPRESVEPAVIKECDNHQSTVTNEDKLQRHEYTDYTTLTQSNTSQSVDIEQHGNTDRTESKNGSSVFIVDESKLGKYAAHKSSENKGEPLYKTECKNGTGVFIVNETKMQKTTTNTRMEYKNKPIPKTECKNGTGVFIVMEQPAECGNGTGVLIKEYDNKQIDQPKKTKNCCNCSDWTTLDKCIFFIICSIVFLAILGLIIALILHSEN